VATITDRVQAHLLAQSLARDPRDSTSSLPPVWRQPANGTPAPGEGRNQTEIGPTAVIGLMHSGGIATPRFESAWRRDIVDIWLRTSKWPDAETLYAAIRGALIDRTNWLMAGMRVIESQEWRALGLLDSSEQQGYTAQFAVLFETYAADHS
jgi:hypothetical protein